MDALPFPTVPLSQVDLGDTMLSYTVRVVIGNPPTNYDLVVDSTTAITWVGASATHPYFSSSGVNTNVPVAVDYHFGTFQGTIWEDEITFSERVNIPRMLIGVASAMQNIAADGVLGIGPTLSGCGALPSFPNQMLPTVVDRLVEQETITRSVVSIFFKPTVANEDNNGELCFGGTNPRKYLRYPGYIDITTTHPSSLHWGINQWIRYRNVQILSYSPGIVDSGCTFLYLSIDAYERYRVATGGTLNLANGLLQISLQQYNDLHELEFHTDTINLKLVSNVQIWPRSLNNKINGGENDIFLVVRSLKTPTGTDASTLFDGNMRRVGFAHTQYTQATTN
ncbi:acid protease [Suillus decipiens]|nr:acid protease [Suillus decipiens]